jgi:endonuclease YncB( thermonuclease family)
MKHACWIVLFILLTGCDVVLPKGIAVIPTALPTPTLPSEYDEFECIPKNTERQVGVVVDVVDATTIEVQMEDGSISRVRYIGIGLYDVFLQYAEEAKSFNEKLVEGKPVTLVRDGENTDENGNLWRYVIVEDTFVNFRMVAGLPRDMSDDCLEMFLGMEMGAAESDRGIWGGAASTP